MSGDKINKYLSKGNNTESAIQFFGGKLNMQQIMEWNNKYKA